MAESRGSPQDAQAFSQELCGGGKVPGVIGLEIEEAKRRLREAGATVFITQFASKKGVGDADSVRVVRERVKNDPQTGMLIVELLVSAFKTKLQTAESSREREQAKPEDE